MEPGRRFQERKAVPKEVSSRVSEPSEWTAFVCVWGWLGWGGEELEGKKRGRELKRINKSNVHFKH